jgi:hypothetical protein
LKFYLHNSIHKNFIKPSPHLLLKLTGASPIKCPIRFGHPLSTTAALLSVIDAAALSQATAIIIAAQSCRRRYCPCIFIAVARDHLSIQSSPPVLQEMKKKKAAKRNETETK